MQKLIRLGFQNPLGQTVDQWKVFSTNAGPDVL